MQNSLFDFSTAIFSNKTLFFFLNLASTLQVSSKLLLRIEKIIVKEQIKKNRQYRALLGECMYITQNSGHARFAKHKPFGGSGQH